MTTEPVAEMVGRFEATSKNSIKASYASIDFLYWELDYLDRMLLMYLNKTTSNNVGEHICDIRARIPDIYKEINYYKQCINVEKQEMKRIHDKYGYGCEKYTQNTYINYNTKYDDEFCDIDYQADDYYDNPLFDDDILEDVREYELNIVTGQYEPKK